MCVCIYIYIYNVYINEWINKYINPNLALEVDWILGQPTVEFSQDGPQLVAAHGLSPAMGLAALRACHGSPGELVWRPSGNLTWRAGKGTTYQWSFYQNYHLHRGFASKPCLNTRGLNRLDDEWWLSMDGDWTSDWGDVVLFPLNVLGYRPTSTLRERPTSQSFRKWMVLRRWVDGVANAFDAYRGLRPAIGGV